MFEGSEEYQALRVFRRDGRVSIGIETISAKEEIHLCTNREINV